MACPPPWVGMAGQYLGRNLSVVRDFSTPQPWTWPNQGGGVPQRRPLLIDKNVSITKANGQNGTGTVCREPLPVPFSCQGSSSRPILNVQGRDLGEEMIARNKDCAQGEGRGRKPQIVVRQVEALDL